MTTLENIYTGDGNNQKIKAIKDVLLKGRNDAERLAPVIESALMPHNFAKVRENLGSKEIMQSVRITENDEVWANFRQSERKTAKVWRCLFTDTFLWMESLEKY